MKNDIISTNESIEIDQLVHDLSGPMLVRLLARIFPLIRERVSIFENCLEIMYEFPNSSFSIEIITKFIPIVLDKEKECTLLVWDAIDRLYSTDIHSMRINTGFSIMIHCFKSLFGSDSSILESNRTKIFEYILTGLRSRNESICKRSLYILKRILDLPPEKLNCLNCEFFPIELSQCDFWEKFILAFETLLERQAHLMVPILRSFPDMVKKPKALPWWYSLVDLGLNDPNYRMVNLFLDYVVVNPPRDMLPVFFEKRFMEDILSKALDNRSPFMKGTSGSVKSPFGESLQSFCYQMIIWATRSDLYSVEDAIMTFIGLLHQLKVDAPIIYIECSLNHFLRENVGIDVFVDDATLFRLMELLNLKSFLDYDTKSVITDITRELCLHLISKSNSFKVKITLVSNLRLDLHSAQFRILIDQKIVNGDYFSLLKQELQEFFGAEANNSVNSMKHFKTIIRNIKALNDTKKAECASLVENFVTKCKNLQKLSICHYTILEENFSLSIPNNEIYNAENIIEAIYGLRSESDDFSILVDIMSRCYGTLGSQLHLQNHPLDFVQLNLISYLPLKYSSDLFCRLLNLQTDKLIYRKRAEFLKWKVIADMMKTCESHDSMDEMILDELMNELAVVNYESFINVLECVLICLNRGLYRNDMIDIIWKTCHQANTVSSEYRAIMEAAIECLFHPTVFDNTLAEDMKKLFDNVLEVGYHAKYFMVSHLAKSLEYNFQERGSGFFSKNLNLVYKLLIFGPFRNEIDRFGDVVMAKRNSSLDNKLYSESPQFCRTVVNSILNSLRADNLEHEKISTELGELMMNNLLLMNESQRAFHANSTQHINRLRILQSYLIIMDLMEVTSPKKTFLTWLQILRTETLQSLKFYIQWIIIKFIVSYNSELGEEFWTAINQGWNSKIAVPMLNICYHTSRYIIESPVSASWFQNVFRHIPRFLTKEHHMVRSLAATCLKTCVEIFLTIPNAESILQNDSTLANLYEFVSNDLDHARSRLKYSQLYRLEDFDPLGSSWSVQCIFETFLKETEVSFTELISPDAFRRVRYREMRVPLVSNSSAVGTRSVQIIPESESVDTEKSNSEYQDLAHVNFQKKVIPWQNLLSSDADFSAVDKSRNRSPLIVVASLLDKPTNLGGICRTCEIFNASCLVVNNMRVKENPKFKSLSVSSEQWIPMTEVVQGDLPEYISEKRLQGYSIVGLEQTTNSKCLDSFSFSEKTVLILGTEKHGIPANILDLLDHCLEIPQKGMTRSLNVHVSAAISLYSYSCQF